MRAFAASVAVALLTLLAAWVSTVEAGGLRPVAALPVNATLGLGLGEVSEPLMPLAKIDCRDSLAVVYGLPGGRPVVAVIYSKSYSSGAPAAVEECVARLEACLVTLGAAPGRLVVQAEETGGNTSTVPAHTVQRSVRHVTITTTPEITIETVTVAAVASGGASQGGTEGAATTPPAGSTGPGATSTSTSPVTSTAAGSPITWRGTQAEYVAEYVPQQGATWRPLAVLAVGAAAAAVAAAWARRAATR